MGERVTPRGIALPGNRWDLLDGRRPDAAPTVSVVVAHYEQPEQLARCVAALGGQDHPRDRLEVIVADDGSTEPPRVPEGVRLVRQADEGFRLAAARNLGAAHATGDVLVFLDADTVPEPGFIRELTRMPGLAPDVVVVGRRRHADLTGAAVVADIRPVVAGRELPEPAWLTDAYRRSRNLLEADDRSYRHTIGAVLACSRIIFDATGGFDESFRSYGGEDWEWTYRAWLKGALLAHVPQAVAWHDGPDAGARDEHDRARRNAEAVLLADLIPVPGSRPHGRPTDRVDVAVTAPPGASEGAAFVSVDSVLAAVPGSEWVDAAALAEARGRLDRVRVHVEIVRPVRVDRILGDLVDSIARDGLGVVTVRADDGTVLLRIRSSRAAAREERWGRDDLFPRASERVDGVRLLVGEPDVAAYLGGWG
ncbi:glycosyltransferase [Microbacterium sp. KSW-18]|uniref:Glycosyltransferase n=1 Tax=Microbacterium aquilitoris TaxID=3067307 RepID=A0ABU3GGB0_9MICO|nr:glycosyltransferase [Microbacterium sp. KSW-18]MDT3329739.1 glycosyltransferase [Microbacterium sp. KSW-18]